MMPQRKKKIISHNNEKQQTRNEVISFPNAKINIGLHVTEKRSDGFHNIETVFYPVQWCDVLEIIRDDENKTDIFFQTTGIAINGNTESNLCVRAYSILAKDFNLPAVKMHLHKIIPAGAGLGGGSADGAFTISSLNKLFDLKLTGDRQINYAQQLGSDCAFFILNKPVFALGKGDEFENISLDLKNYFITIVKPAINVSTAEAYSEIRPEKKNPSLKELISLPVEEWKNNIVNDFEENIFRKYPEIKKIKSDLYEAGATYASMSGSGSSVFGIFKNKTDVNEKFAGCKVWNGTL